MESIDSVLLLNYKCSLNVIMTFSLSCELFHACTVQHGFYCEWVIYSIEFVLMVVAQVFFFSLLHYIYLMNMDNIQYTYTSTTN